MKYKLHNLMASALVVSSLFPLSGCNANKEVTYNMNHEFIYLVNPLDWNRTPDIVSFEVNGYNFSMDIDSFYSLINQPKDTVSLSTNDGDVIVSTVYLKEKADEAFYDFQNNRSVNYLKAVITLGEIAGAIKLGKKAKEKIKKLS